MNHIKEYRGFYCIALAMVLLTVLFTVLKINAVIAWSWWLVLLPSWLFVGFWVACIVGFAAIVRFVRWRYETAKDENTRIKWGERFWDIAWVMAEAEDARSNRK